MHQHNSAVRDAILRKLRRAQPAQPLPLPDLRPYHAGPWGQGVAESASGLSLMDSFERAASGWRAQVHRTSTRQWAETLRNVLQRHRCHRIAMGPVVFGLPGMDDALRGRHGITLERPVDEWRGLLFDGVDASITLATAGIADTGTLVILPGRHEPRALSLVPPIHIALLRASTLHASLAKAIQALRPQEQLPTNFLLVTGPSKTADIQQTLAYGAHGPKDLVILLIDDFTQHFAG